LLTVELAPMAGEVDWCVPYPGAAAIISVEILGKARSRRARSSRVGAWPSAARWNQARPAFNPICFSSKVNPREISPNPLDNKQSRRLFAGKWHGWHRSYRKNGPPPSEAASSWPDAAFIPLPHCSRRMAR